MKRSLVLALAGLGLGVGLSFAADPPLMKEGYWSIHTLITSNPGNKKTESTQTICRNHEYEQYVRNMATKGRTGCKILVDNYSGGTYTVEQECTIGGTTLHSKTVSTSQGDSASHTEAHTTNTPPQYGEAESTTIMDQKYLGACPAGIQPGDIVRADGRKTNAWKK